MGNFRTVVFQVENEVEFDKLWAQLCDSMRDGKLVNGAKVTGLSLDDVMSELEQLEESIQGEWELD
ncbi:MAG: hypothetical protein ACRCYB_00055 [Aeromonas veronii]